MYCKGAEAVDWRGSSGRCVDGVVGGALGGDGDSHDGLLVLRGRLMVGYGGIEGGQLGVEVLKCLYRAE